MPRLDWVVPLLVATTFVASSASSIVAQSVEREVVVTVLDRDRAPVPGLAPEDFVVLEDGSPREVIRVSEDTQPRQIALLVDTSQASDRAIAHFRSGVSAFVEEMAGDHDISLISFGGPPRILVPSTRDADRLEDGIGQLFSQSTSAAYLLDALRETTAGFVKREVDRPVIVVLATEGPDYSHIDSTTVLRGLEESAIAVHTVVLMDRRVTAAPVFGEPGLGVPNDDPLAQWRLERDRGLNQAPRITGGSRRDLLASTGTKAAMRELARELRSQYLVVYSRPDTLIPPRKIEVGPAREGLTVRRTPVRPTQ